MTRWRTTDGDTVEVYTTATTCLRTECTTAHREYRYRVTAANGEIVEPVTSRENTLRGETSAAANAAKTHCPQGHPYDEKNTCIRRQDGARVCRRCRAALVARSRKRKATA